MDQVPAVERATPDGLYVEHGRKPFGGLEVAGRGGWAARQGVGEHAGAELVDDLTGGVVVHVGHRGVLSHGRHPCPVGHYLGHRPLH